MSVPVTVHILNGKSTCISPHASQTRTCTLHYIKSRIQTLCDGQRTKSSFTGLVYEQVMEARQSRLEIINTVSKALKQ